MNTPQQPVEERKNQRFCLHCGVDESSNHFSCEYTPSGSHLFNLKEDSNTTEQSWKLRFDEQFGHLTLGILAGGKNNPVFVNNDLEIPHLKSFIASELSLTEERVRRECIEAQKKCDDIFEDYIDPYVQKKIKETLNEVLNLNKGIRRLISPTEIVEYAESKGITLNDKEV